MHQNWPAESGRQIRASEDKEARQTRQKSRKRKRTGRTKTYGQILLVGKDQEDGVAELVLVEHALQLLAGLDDKVAIVGVDHEDDALGVLEVVSPQGADLVLSSDIPHGELNVAVFDGLDVEACMVRC